MNSSPITADQVVDLAERYLAKHQPADYRILIDRDGVSVGADGWWEIPIRPSTEDAPSYDWTGRSAEAAVDMDEAEGIHVLFV